MVLADTEDTWHALFRNMGKTYEEPKLALLSGAAQSRLRFCLRRSRLLLLSDGPEGLHRSELLRRPEKPVRGIRDFAQAYVIAHEVGHHVQNLLGIAEKVQSLRSRSSEAEANRLSVMMEVQADCLAGVWAYNADRARQILEKGDIEEALNAASSIGDDRIQRQSRGYVRPDAFTHGTSSQRVRWFRRGLETGDMGECNTFQADRL